MESKTIEFSLKDGTLVTLEMTSKLVEDVLKAFSLKSSDEMTDKHVKLYLASGMKKALETNNVED